MLERTDEVSPLLPTENENKSSAKWKAVGVTGLILMVLLVFVVSMGQSENRFLNKQNSESVQIARDLHSTTPPILEPPQTRPGATAPPPTRHVCPTGPSTAVNPPMVLSGLASFALLTVATTPKTLPPSGNGLVLLQFSGGASVRLCNLGKHVCAYNLFSGQPVVQLQLQLLPSTTYELAIGYWRSSNTVVVVLTDITKRSLPHFKSGRPTAGLLSNLVRFGPMDSLSMWVPVTNSPPTKNDVFVCPPPPPSVPAPRLSSSSEEDLTKVVYGQEYLSFDQFKGEWPH